MVRIQNISRPRASLTRLTKHTPHQASPPLSFTTQRTTIVYIMHYKFKDFQEAAEGLKKLLPEDFIPEVGIICGSGLSGLQEAVTGLRIEVPYSDIKGFPISTGQLKSCFWIWL